MNKVTYRRIAEAIDYGARMYKSDKGFFAFCRGYGEPVSNMITEDIAESNYVAQTFRKILLERGLVYGVDEEDGLEDYLKKAQYQDENGEVDDFDGLGFDKVGNGALKELGDKPRIDLVPSEMIEGIADVLTYGAKKYDDHNWRKGIPFSVTYAAAMRHLLKFHKGIDLDAESGLHHLKHAACNILMLLCNSDMEELDDRFIKHDTGLHTSSSDSDDNGYVDRDTDEFVPHLSYNCGDYGCTLCEDGDI